MPALPNVPGVIRFDLHFLIGTDGLGKCRFYMKYSGAAPTAAQLNTLATYVVTDFNAQLAPLMTNQNQLSSVTITDLTSATGAVGNSSGTSTGSRTGAALPGSTCLLLSLTITRRYRGGHPRIYWPFGVVTDLASEQTWTSAFTTAAIAAFNNFFNNINLNLWAGGGSVTQVNVGFYKGFTVHTGTTGRARNVSTVNPAGPTVDTIVSYVARTGVADQRKRLLHLA